MAKWKRDCDCHRPGGHQSKVVAPLCRPRQGDWQAAGLAAHPCHLSRVDWPAVGSAHAPRRVDSPVGRPDRCQSTAGRRDDRLVLRREKDEHRHGRPFSHPRVVPSDDWKLGSHHSDGCPLAGRRRLWVC